MTIITTNERDTILAALVKWINQRPGLEFGNYGDVRAYRAELRGITRDKKDAEVLLESVSRSQITADDLKKAFESAYMGRLRWDADKRELDYCTGQYWPTEYRKAVCAVLSSALWNYHREDYAKTAKGDETPGAAIRREFKRKFGSRMAKRWFD